MAAMTFAVGVAYREIYSWKAAILYRRFVCQGTPSFVALEKTGFFEESARAAYTSRKASSEFMLAILINRRQTTVFLRLQCYAMAV